MSRSTSTRAKDEEAVDAASRRYALDYCEEARYFDPKWTWLARASGYGCRTI
jgi:hypothetical protein